MADAIIDGRGSGNFWGIDEDNAGFVKVLDSSGNNNANPLGRYVSAETDNTLAPGSIFTGYEAADGSWVILGRFASGGDARILSSRYVAGNTNLAGSWAVRTTLSYETAGSVF